MKRRSPTLEGFQIMFRLPSLGLAEITWRWTFGLAVTAGLLFFLREYLATLPVTAGEMVLLRTQQPALIFQALARIFQGSAPRATLALIGLTVTLTVAWIVLASLGRAAILKALFEHFGGSTLTFSTSRTLTSLLALNFLRAATMLAASISVVGAMLVATSASSPVDPSPGRVLLIFWLFTMLTGLAWSLLNWYLSVAAIFVVGEGASAFAALVAATGFCRTRAGSLTAAAIWFGIAHAIVFVVATSVSAFPLGFADVLPGSVVFGGLLLVGLLYFAAVDFLYAGRLAAYVFMIEPPPLLRSDDDILSDIPGLVPEPS
jgi:hypothetical protein